MADTPILIGDLFTDINDMQSAFAPPECTSPTLPMISFGGGTPPTIDFNMPQGTAFTTYGYLLKYIDPTWFKDFTKLPPTNNYFDMMENMTTEQAIQLFHPNVAAPQQTIIGTFTPAFTATPYHTVVANNQAARNPRNAPPIHSVSGNEPIVMRSDPAPKPPSQMAEFAKQGLRPILMYRLGNQGATTKYIGRPPFPVPRIIVIEEYTTESFLGNYGAGRVVKTFSLFPGERTTISVRTYNDQTSTSSKSDNVLDSFSDSSAVELDNLMQIEQGNLASTTDTSGGSGSSFSTNSDSKNSSSSFGISGGLNLGPLSIGGGYGQSQSDVTNSTGGFTNTYDYNHTGVRQSNINTLNNALNKHVQQSNSARQVDVNTSTTDTASSGEEDTTVREIVNYNKSRTLNIVFRQLMQEYYSITYLSNLKFAYTNGYPESYRVVDLNNLPNMLLDIINTDSSKGGDPDNINNVLCKLLQPYCNVLDYEYNTQTFLASKTITPSGSCITLPSYTCTAADPETIYYVNPACLMTYPESMPTPPLPFSVTVNGVILSVKKQILQTPSLIADALLGRGEALDCYNQNAQEADNMADYMANVANMQRIVDNLQNTNNNQQFADQAVIKMTNDNAVVTQQMGIIDAISGSDPTAADQVAGYKKVFGDCCPTPQYTGGCGCGNCTE